MTLGNTDGALAGLPTSDPPTKAELQAPRSNRESLPSDVRALSALGHALRGVALAAVGVVKGGA